MMIKTLTRLIIPVNVANKAIIRAPHFQKCWDGKKEVKILERKLGLGSEPRCAPNSVILFRTGTSIDLNSPEEKEREKEKYLSNFLGCQTDFGKGKIENMTPWPEFIKDEF